VTHTEIAGLTLGGGSGWLERKLGFTADNLLSVDVVTADGRLIKTSRDENEDLFWGLRGGGGNFGVVTSFEYRIHSVGPIVLGGLLMYPAERAGEVLRFYRDFIAGATDDRGGACAFVTAPASRSCPSPCKARKSSPSSCATSDPSRRGRRRSGP